MVFQTAISICKAMYAISPMAGITRYGGAVVASGTVMVAAPTNTAIITDDATDERENSENNLRSMVVSRSSAFAARACAYSSALSRVSSDPPRLNSLAVGKLSGCPVILGQILSTAHSAQELRFFLML